MEYPHRRYIKYLVTRRLQDAEISHACTVRGLQPPTDNDVTKLRREVGPLPAFWQPDLGKSSTKLYRWLRDRGVLELWQKTPASRTASEFLYAHNTKGVGARPDLEHLLLLDWDIAKAREHLVLKYGELRVPDLKGLQVYVKFFWNLPEMSQGGIFHYLETLDKNETQLQAYSGDMAATYGLIGLRQKIEDEEFYDNVIALANEEVLVARKNAGRNSGTTLMAIAGLAKVADGAIQSRRELRTAGLGDTIRAELQAFRLRKRESAPQIPSYEDLVAGDAENDNVIDVTSKLEVIRR